MPLFKKKEGGTAIGNLIRKSSGAISSLAAGAGASLGIPPGITKAVVGGLTSTTPPPFSSIGNVSPASATLTPSSSVQTKDGSAGTLAFFASGFYDHPYIYVLQICLALYLLPTWYRTIRNIFA